VPYVGSSGNLKKLISANHTKRYQEIVSNHPVWGLRAWVVIKILAGQGEWICNLFPFILETSQYGILVEPFPESFLQMRR
jgi:hypothetical protein